MVSYPSMRVHCALSLVLFLSLTEIAECTVFRCTGSDYYNPNATFSGVFIDSSISYGFVCSYEGYKSRIAFTNSSMDDLPKKLFDSFPAVKIVNVSNCNIQHINRYSLESARYLQYLYISHNALEEIKSNVFSSALALVMLDLSFNRIASIESAAFSSLEALQILYLNGNRLRQLDGKLFVGLPLLHAVFLGHNELEVIEGDLFVENELLQNVLLHDNRISVVDESVFAGESLKFVSLQNNRLTKLNLRDARVKKVLLGNNSLEELYLSPWIEALFADNNRIAQIHVDRSQNISLATLSLKNNSITSVETVGWMQSLVTLDLTNNTLGPLTIDSFAKLPNLQQLVLERTGVSNLQHGTFAQQERLQWLDLSYNNLDTFDVDILTSSTELQNLYLDGNRLKSIEYATMKTLFPALTELGLVDNRWNCTFLSNIVRYCTANNIRLVKGEPSELVLNQTNVKGIYCSDEKNPISRMHTNVEHLLSSNSSEAGALQAMLQSVLDDVKRFGEGHGETLNRTDKLEGTLFDLTRRQLALDNGLLELRKSLLDLRLTLLSNRTNASAVGTDELRRMIDSVNNLTLEKQHLAEERLELKINTQSFRVDQALETARANVDKLTVLGRRVEQWISNALSPGGAVGLFAADKHHQQQLQQPSPDSSDGRHSTGLLVAVLVMVCLMTGVLVFALLRTHRSSTRYGVERRRYTNRDSSLTTIVDNDI